MLTEQPKATEFPKDKAAATSDAPHTGDTHIEPIETQSSNLEAPPAGIPESVVPSLTVTDHEDKVSNISHQPYCMI